jgi:3-methyladenine DNA glycosylase AlkD
MNLASDPEIRVQKAVGRSLKDLMRSDEQGVMACVEKLRLAEATAVIIRYALRDQHRQAQVSQAGKR